MLQVLFIKVLHQFQWFLFIEGTFSNTCHKLHGHNTA